MLVGKISNDECSVLLKTIENTNETNILNCFNEEEDACYELDRNTLLLDSQAYETWEGFDTPGEMDRETEYATDGSSVTYNQFRQNRELLIVAKFCKCKCWNEKIGCLLNDCCNDNVTNFEFLNSCGKWIKVQINLNSFQPEGFEESGCGYINILAEEQRQKYIYVSSEYAEYPTYTTKFDTVEICDDCVTDCYSVEKWNATKKFCFDSSTGKIIFNPLQEMSEFVLIWNNVAVKIYADLVKNDIVEIQGGNVYINGDFHISLKTLGINYQDTNTTNGLDCVTIQTVDGQGSFGAVDYKKILSCEYEVWGK